MYQEEGKQNAVDSFPMAAGELAYDRFGGMESSPRDDPKQQDQLIEDRLIDAAQSGNLSAFNQLVVMYQDSLYRWVLSLVKDEDLAEDLAQSTFIAAYEKMRTFRGGAFRGWLFKIARNRCFDELRRQKRRPSISLDASLDNTEEASENDFTLLSVISSNDPLPEEAAAQSERAELISRLLEALPEGYRQMLQLVDVEELDYPEVSEALQIPLGTVKSRLARARLKFRERAIQIGLLP